jgi:PAS domain S-box-containing protein
MRVMKKDILRNASLPALLAGGFILLDLALDRSLGGPGRLGWPHLILAVSVLLVSYMLVSRAMSARRRAEAVLRQARDEMESRVAKRTAELEHANEALQTEVTERKRVEQALRASEETARALMNSSSESALLLNAQGVVLASNETAAKRLGVTVERLVGSPLLDFFAPEVAEKRRSYLNAILDSHQPIRFTDERDGRTFENQVYPVLDPDGSIIRLAVFGQDISERMRAEEMLRTSEEKYRMLFQNMAEGFALYELLYDEQGEPVDWRVLEVNAAYTLHTGIARDRILGRRIGELFPAALSEYLPHFATVVASQTPHEFETYASAVERYLRVITFPAGGPRFASTIEDITKRKQSEEQLRRAQAELALDAQKRGLLEERQRLARELHDSVAQTLYGISLGVNTALTLYDVNRAKAIEALDYALSLAHSGLTEMRALIFELRPESLEMEGLVVALGKQVDALRARHSIEVKPDLCGEPDVPLATKEALFRIAQEAMQNAVKHARSQRLDVRLACEQESVCLEVDDNGIGFDPLATYPGHLGLHSMRERAMSVGGSLDINSAPGSGTQIRVRVPVATPDFTQAW